MVLLVFFSLLAFSRGNKTHSEYEATIFDVQGVNGFVGTVNETNAFIAPLVAESEGTVYVCNGEEEIAEWFRGDLNDPQNVNLAHSAGT